MECGKGGESMCGMISLSDKEMRLPAHQSIVQALVSAIHDDDRRDAALDFYRMVSRVPISTHFEAVQECLLNDTYTIEVSAELHHSEKILMKLCNENETQEFVCVGDVTEIAIGHKKNFHLSLSIVNSDKVQELRKKKVKRVRRSSSLFLNKFTRLKKKNEEGEDSVALEDLTVNVPRTFAVIGRKKSYPVEIILKKETRRENVPRPRFRDLLNLTKCLYDHERKNRSFDGELSEIPYSILHLTFLFHQLPGYLLRVITVSVLLESNSSPDVLMDEIDQLVNVNLDVPFEECKPLVQEALDHLRVCVTARMSSEWPNPRSVALFPPVDYHSVVAFNSRIKHFLSLCVWEGWERLDVEDPSLVFRDGLIRLLQASALQWCRSSLVWECDLFEMKEREVCLIFDQLYRLIQTNSSLFIIFFDQFQINYLEESISSIRDKIDEFVHSYIQFRLDQINPRCRETMEQFTKCTMKLFESLRMLSNLINEKSDGVSLCFESAFADAPIHWCTTWRIMSGEMVQRVFTTSDEDDGEQASPPLPKGLYSFLCIQKGISDDFMRVQFSLSHNLYMAITYIVHIFCENLVSYANKLVSMANEFKGDSRQKEIRMLRSANGIEQSCTFIGVNWKRFVRGKDVAGEEGGDAILKTAEKLLHAAQKKCLHLRNKLICAVCARQDEQYERIAKSIVLDRTEFRSSLAAYVRELTNEERLDSIADSVITLVHQLSSLQLPSGAKVSMKYTNVAIRRKLRKLVKPEQPESYYKFIYDSLQMLDDVTGCPVIDSHLQQLLYLYTQPTTDIILSWYTQMTELCDRTNGGPALTIQAAYTRCNNNVSLVLHVCESYHESCLWSPSLRFELLPRFLFPFVEHRTLCPRSHRKSSKYKWRHTFRMLIPEEKFFTNGAVASLSVVDRDYLALDRLMGSIFIPLARIPESPVLPSPCTWRLVTPPSLTDTPLQTVLASRTQRDPAAKQFLRSEAKHSSKYTLPRNELFKRASTPSMCTTTSCGTH